MEIVSIILSSTALALVTYHIVSQQLATSKPNKTLGTIVKLSEDITKSIPANLKQTIDLIDKKSSKALLGVATIASVLVKENNLILEKVEGLTDDEKVVVTEEVNNLSNHLINITSIRVLSTHIWINTSLGTTEIDKSNFAKIRTGSLGEFIR